jgi:hypothetical protein
MRLDMNEWYLGDKDSIGYMEYGNVLWYELNQHHNSKKKTYDWDTTHLTQITQL